MNSIIQSVTGLNFNSEYQQNINKSSYYKIKRWLQYMLLKAKKCIQKIHQVCEVYFEPKRNKLKSEQFYISISQCQDGQMFTLKKRTYCGNAVNERFSKIDKSQFFDFVNGEFDLEKNKSDDLLFEFCQKAKVEELKASYACHFEREEYLFKHSGLLLSIDKDMEFQVFDTEKKLPIKSNQYRMRLKDFGSNVDFNIMKNRIVSVCG